MSLLMCTLHCSSGDKALAGHRQTELSRALDRDVIADKYIAFLLWGQGSEQVIGKQLWRCLDLDVTDDEHISFQLRGQGSEQALSRL